MWVAFVLGAALGFLGGIFAGVSFAHQDEQERQARIRRMNREAQ